MDMVFKRYSCPFTLFNNLIRTKKLSSFIDNLIEEVNEEKIYELWLNKVYDKEYSDFRKQVMNSMEFHKHAQNAPKISTETILEDANSVLDMITPQ